MQAEKLELRIMEASYPASRFDRVRSHQSDLFSAERDQSPELSSIRYLQRYLKGTVHWLDRGARFAATAEKQEALRLAEQAHRLYAGLEK